MAVVNTKSTAITNADATPAVLTNRAIVRGPVCASIGTVEVAAADDDGSVFRFARIPSNAIVYSIQRFNDAIATATAYDIGIYQTAENGGAAVDDDVFASAVDISAGTVLGVEHRFEAGDIVNIEKRLWELLGLTSDPNLDYDLCMTGDTVGSAAGTIALRALWAV